MTTIMIRIIITESYSSELRKFNGIFLVPVASEAARFFISFYTFPPTQNRILKFLLFISPLIRNIFS